METTSVFKGTRHSCSPNLVAKSLESHIKIDSISIDLINANDDTDTRKCEHFSIRGYASEMRKKDWKKSWPFALDGDQNIFKEQICKLPPLLVPKFRWWCCQNCLQETGTEGGINEERTVTNNCRKLKSFGSCSHVPSRGDALTCSSDLQQTGKIYVDSRKSGAVACVNVNSSTCHPLVSDKSEKKAENADIPVIGKADILENNNIKEIHISNYAGIEVISSLMRKTIGFDEKVASLQLRNPDLKDNEVAGVKLPESNVECAVKDATETHQTGKFACDQQMELVKGSRSHGIASTVHRVPNAIKNHTDEHPSLELGDCDYASSESDEVFPGTVSGSLHRRKNHKVRLLTELLGTNEDEKTNLASTEDSPSSTIPDASIGIDSISTFQGHVNFQRSVRSSLARRKKRRMPQDEEWVPGEFMCSPNNGHKNLKTINRDAESADGITSSDSEGTINRSSSRTPAKSSLVNAKVGKGTILGKKKSKKTQNFDECSSLHLSRENLQKEGQKKPPGDITKNDASDIVLYKSNDVSTGSGLNPFPESALKAEKKFNLLKKKNKMHQKHDWQASQVPWNNGNLREGPVLRKDVEIRQTGNVAVLLEVTQDTSAEKGLQFCPSNSLSTKSYDAKYSTPIRGGQVHVLSEYDTGGKDLNINYVSQADANVWKGIHDLNSNHTTYKIPFLNEMQKDRSPAEVGSSSIQLMDFSGTSNNGRTVEFRDHATVAREHYDKRVEMASEQGAADDIMEIAELMAKNQYERCLPDTEIYKQLPETSNAKNHQMVDLNEVYENEEMNLFQETTDKLEPQAKNGRIGKFLRGDNVGSTKQKSVDYFSHIDRNQCSMSQLEQRYSPAGFRPFPLCGEKPFNGVQLSATNSIKKNTAQNCQWIGNMVGQKSSHANVQALGACKTCQSAAQQNKEAAHLRPSMMLNMPHIPGIPHICADQVAKLDVFRHCPSNLPKGNMSRNDDRNLLNLDSNYEKHCGKFDSEALRRTHADYPFPCKHNGTESLDLYSNETISAMHLLSLMDAGLQSGAPVDGNQRFVKKTPFLPDHHSKEFSSMPSGGYRTNSMKHPSFDCYGKSHLPESFCKCMSATAADGPSISFRRDKSFKKAPEFTGHFSLKSREKEKKKCSDSQRQNKNHESKKSVSSNSGLNTTCGSILVHSMPKLALGTSEGKVHVMESATKHKQKSRTSSGTLFHPKSGSENGICGINRNPADFTVPGAGNMYMIDCEDLKFRREKAHSSGLVKIDWAQTSEEAYG
ncbi:Embryonic flower 1, putative isoform 2 [Hibiscus syriacus]|uniref:Embryonic flower 1, putative isoform 2 n=1 Tax=Hibiscus syriacus TaxID=106335 RepID=A0A6A2Z7T1_HIBSY|nr:protein EMBRYONIC FLOWER 1-like [Hibiscus syriacus]KAE8687633.1 Embryonic flower 1, putative isoform 2 [Hibiscus syriacus]